MKELIDIRVAGKQRIRRLHFREQASNGPDIHLPGVVQEDKFFFGVLQNFISRKRMLYSEADFFIEQNTPAPDV